MNFTRLIRGVSRRFPENDAVVEGERSVNFRQLWQYIGAIGAYYRALGIAPGDRILVVLPNSLNFLVFHFAALKIGAVSVPVKAECKSREVSQIAEDCRPEVLISSDEWLAENGSTLCLPPGVRIASVDEVTFDGEGDSDHIYPATIDTVASINYCYTGQGNPRGAMLTHGNHIYAATGYAVHQGFHSADRFLIILPMSHVFALSGCVNSGLIRGAALVILNETRPKSIFRAIQQHRITILTAVPVIFEYLADYPRRADFDLSSLRRYVTGGDHLPRELQQSFSAALSTEMVQGYGLTECLPVICNPPGPRNRPGTLGLPGRRDIQLRILGTGLEPLPAGQPGEIAIRSPTTMKGYYRRPEETNRVLRDGWLLTGDRGSLDEDGYLHFHGRTKNVFNIYGSKVDPLEVTQTLLEHPSVKEAHVYPEPSTSPGGRLRTTTICANVTVTGDPSVTELDIRRFLMRRLAKFKVPKKISLIRLEEAAVPVEPGEDCFDVMTTPLRPAPG